MKAHWLIFFFFLWVGGIVAAFHAWGWPGFSAYGLLLLALAGLLLWAGRCMKRATAQPIMTATTWGHPITGRASVCYSFPCSRCGARISGEASIHDAGSVRLTGVPCGRCGSTFTVVVVRRGKA